MKTCPTCGFSGEQDLCPNDGERLLNPVEMAAIAPEDPTMAPPVDPVDKTMAPPSEVTQRQHADAAQKAEGADAEEDPDAIMRGEDFGNWAEPELKKKKKKDPMVGRTIGDRYEVKSLLGKGGMGAVYKAYQPAVQRTIALKVLLKEFADNETVIKRFHQEAVAASRLKHPNTVSVYDFGQTDDNILYIAMEYLRGESLAQALTREKMLSPKRAVHVMRQCCKSLSEAHKAGIIHRDLKPDNIFLAEVQGERDFAKVLDFGVAKLKEMEGQDGTLTQAGMIFGTPKYMSPEQARSSAVDHRSDVYALGVILYEMVLGRPPFTGDNPLSILIAHVNESVKSFAEVRPDLQLPAPLEAVVFKALAKNIDERHRDVDELLAELEAVDELLEGASYDSVKDRLPQTIPGAGGNPSLVGPAIVPAGTDGTAPGQIGVGGDTVVLDANGQPVVRGDTHEVLGIGNVELSTDDLDPVRPASGPPVALIAALALPLLAGAGWLVMGNTGTEAVPDAAPIAAMVPDGAVATAVPDAAVVAKKAPDAAQVAAAAKPDAAAEPKRPTVAKKTKTFVVESSPAKARIHDARSGRVVGVTPKELTITATRKYIVRKSGYHDAQITLSMGDSNRKMRLVKLKPHAVAAKPKPVQVRTGGSALPTRPTRPKPPADDPTDSPLDLE